MGQERKQRGSFFELNCNDILTILCAAAVPIALGIYTAITYQQEQEQQKKMQELALNQSTELRRDKIYDNFLKNVYNLDKHGYLGNDKNPWAFANAYYRAAHRQLDSARKGDVLQFLKERGLIGRNNCTSTCGYKAIEDIIRLNELSFDHMDLSSQTGTLTRLNLECVSFDQVSMNNVKFVYVNLHGGSFAKSRLMNVNFGNSSLKCVSFTGTEFENVNFGDSDLTDAKFDEGVISKLNLTEKQKQQLIIDKGSTAKTTVTTVSTSLLFYGVQVNFDPGLLSKSWSNCYTGKYGESISSSNVSNILLKCNGSKLLLGCRPVGNSLFTVAAMSNRADVLYDCGSIKNCSHEANGVEWYFSDSYSWGFAQGGDSVNRISCDEAFTNSIHRLCWHTDEGTGFRCGNNTWLNLNKTWERVIYHVN